MTTAKTIGYIMLAGMASAFVVAAGGLVGNVGAQQRGSRPFIPRPSEMRPLSRALPSALPAPPSTARATGQSPPPTTKATGDSQKHADLDLLDPTVDERTGITTGRDVVYKEDDMVVTGAKARYTRFNKNTGMLEAEGNLVLDDPKYHITGDKASYDNRANAKIAIVTGTVVIVIKPKDKPSDTNPSDVAKQKSNGATIYCDRLDYFRNKKFVVLTGHLIFKQTITKDNGRTVERTMTAEHAEHDQKADKMHLFAPVEVKDTDDQEGHFDKDVFVGTKEGEETLQSSGRFKGKINVDSDDADDTKGTTPDPKKPEPGKEPQGAGKQDPPPSLPDKKEDPPVKKIP